MTCSFPARLLDFHREQCHTLPVTSDGQSLPYSPVVNSLLSGRCLFLPETLPYYHHLCFVLFF